MLLRTQVDRITGQLSDTRTRFLGTRPPKLFAANVKSQRSMLSLSSRPWLGYSDMGRYNLTPLSYEALDYASGTFKLSALLCFALLCFALLCFALLCLALLCFESASCSLRAALTALHTLIVLAAPMQRCHRYSLWKLNSRQLSDLVLLDVQALRLSSVQRALWRLPRTRCAF